MSDTILIYGAYGYTGALISRQLASTGAKPILAGRDPARTQALADELGLTALPLNITDTGALHAAFENVAVVLNCAGPFLHTFGPMTAASLATKTHYLDITGEYEVIEGCAALETQAKSAGVTLMPGCGFDVVPTDCLSAMLARRLPEATHLTLAFKGMDQASRGTATTMAAYLGDLPMIRKNGALTARARNETQVFDLGDGPERLPAMTWGDIASAYYTTGIPSIEVFIKPTPDLKGLLALPMFLRRLIASPPLRPVVNAKLRAMPDGPDAAARAAGAVQVYGQAEAPGGETVELRLKTPEGYHLTSLTAARIATHAANGDLPVGFQTPARALGPDFILSFDGCTLAN